MKNKRIRLRLNNDGFINDVLLALLENGFSVKREHNEREAHVDIVFWDGYYFIEEEMK